MYVYIYICMYVCVHIYLCVYICMCMFVCMYVYVCMYVCICICVYVCVYVCMYVRMYVCVFFNNYQNVPLHRFVILHACFLNFREEVFCYFSFCSVCPICLPFLYTVVPEFFYYHLFRDYFACFLDVLVCRCLLCQLVCQFVSYHTCVCFNPS